MWLESFNKMRRDSGMSLDDLSEKSGVPKGTLAKITSGITKAPSLETMRSLVYAMGYTLNDLDEYEKTPPSRTEPSQGEEVTKEEREAIDKLIAAGLIKEGVQLSDADVEFISHILTVVDMWFDQR